MFSKRSLGNKKWPSAEGLNIGRSDKRKKSEMKIEWGQISAQKCSGRYWAIEMEKSGQAGRMLTR